MKKKIDLEHIKKVREQNKREYEECKVLYPWLFNFMGDLKTKYRNVKCPCGSGQKLKFCYGIKYS